MRLDACNIIQQELDGGHDSGNNLLEGGVDLEHATYRKIWIVIHL